jgi:hypothetical protein
MYFPFPLSLAGMCVWSASRKQLVREQRKPFSPSLQLYPSIYQPPPVHEKCKLHHNTYGSVDLLLWWLTRRIYKRQLTVLLSSALFRRYVQLMNVLSHCKQAAARADNRIFICTLSPVSAPQRFCLPVCAQELVDDVSHTHHLLQLLRGRISDNTPTQLKNSRTHAH